MRMDRSHSSSSSSSSSSTSEAYVVAVEVVAGSSKAEEWSGGWTSLQSGDVLEELRFGDVSNNIYINSGVPSSSSPSSQSIYRAPFKGGKSGVQKLLKGAYKKGDTSVTVRVRRTVGNGVLADEWAEMQACVVPHSLGNGGRKQQYVVRSIHDPNYAIGFVDRSESECVAIQGSKSSRVIDALSKAQVQDGYVSYPWEKKMRQSLRLPNSSSFLSLLFLPRAFDTSGSHYNNLEDTLSRANAWLNSAQSAGVPVMFVNIQTEALLTKISGEMASSTVKPGSLSDLSNLANASLYGFEDYHGVDIGMVRAVRLWYAPVAGEMPLEIKLREGDTKLGFSISRTEEGFIYISSVVEDNDDRVASTRSGLRELYKAAERASKVLVISRLANEKILPWMVASTGAIRCFDTVSVSQKLSLHRHALRPILLHIFMWDPPSANRSSRLELYVDASPPTFPPSPNRNFIHPDIVYDLNPGGALGRDAVGETSFRFHELSLPSNWD